MVKEQPHPPEQREEPLAAEEEVRVRAYVSAAAREVDFAPGGMFEMAARLIATLDRERTANVTLPADHARGEGEGLREALHKISHLTGDMPAAYGNAEEWYRQQFHVAVGTAARALAAAAPEPTAERLPGIDLPDGWAMDLTFHPYPENRWIASAWNFNGGVGHAEGYGRTFTSALRALAAALARPADETGSER